MILPELKYIHKKTKQISKSYKITEYWLTNFNILNTSTLCYSKITSFVIIIVKHY